MRSLLAPFWLVVVFVIFSTPFSSAVAVVDTIQEAARLSLAGDHAAAEAIYDRLLKADPNNIQARVNRGHTRSQQGKYKAAQEDFLVVLKANPKNVDVLTDLGYIFAWSGEYAKAEERFRQTLQIEPSRIDAKKGLAFVSLWSGDAKEAILRFEKITKEHPRDAEAAVGLAQALLAAGHHRRARKAFRHALVLEPGRTDAMQGLEAVRDAPSPLEFTLWGGHTFDGGDTGLRSAEMAGWPAQDIRLWIRYDNALSLDNPGLVRKGEEIPSIHVGGLTNWMKNFTTRLELGQRELEDNIDQTLYQGEQIFYLPRGISMKLGGFLGPRDDDNTDWNIYTGLGFPFGPRSRFEPTLFYTKTDELEEKEWRLLLSGEYRFNRGWRVVSGIAFGRLESDLPGASENLWGGYLMTLAPLGEAHRAYLLFRYEEPANADPFAIVALGFTLRLERE